MAIISAPWSPSDDEVDYPVSDGKPMAETPIHRRNMTDLIGTLEAWYADDPLVYISGNMFLYYVRGDRRRHVSPDVFVVRGVPKLPERRAYFVWREGKGPDVVFEFTSESTRDEDLQTKFVLYRDQLKVPEYFLFDPYADYLDPPLQGHHLRAGEYVPIEAVDHRLPSAVLGLHLERHGWQLRLYDPVARAWLPTPQERAERAEAVQQQTEADREREAAARKRAEAARKRAEAARKRAEARAERAEAEIERLRRELDASQRPPEDD